MIVKNEQERETLREVGKKHATILKQLAAMVAPGVSTMELEEETKRLIREAGGEPAFLNYRPESAKRPYPAALCASINDAIVHGIPNENPVVLKEGDVISIDCGFNYKGFITDAAVCLIVGGGGEDDKKLLQASHEALEAGIREARAGNRVGDIGAAIEAVGTKYGFGSPRELGGHSVGRAVHEEPFIPNFGPKGAGPKLEEGMVLAIEPMFTLGSGRIYLDKDGYTYRTKDGSKSAHVEHTVIVGKNGAEILTK